MKARPFPLSRIVTRDEVPEAGLEIDMEANAGELDALAAFLDIPAVAALTARLEVRQWRTRGLAVHGRLQARVRQTCVVTLEPVDNVVDEEIETFFAPGAGRGDRQDARHEIEAAGTDIEPLVDGRVDLGALVTEHLALGLDPYPRKPGVVFEDGDGANAPEPGPFTALRSLRREPPDD